MRWQDELENRPYHGTESFYRNAFFPGMSQVWGNTIFKNEVEHLCFSNALASFLRNTMEGEMERRKLLYYYLSPNFDTDSTDDILNEMAGVLPTDNLEVLRALRSICVIYNDQASREVKGKNNTLLLEILEKLSFDSIMQKIYRAAKLCGEVAVRPRFWNKEPQLYYLTPDKYRVKWDAYGQMTEFWAHFTKEENLELRDYFHVWTKDAYKVKNTSQEDQEFEFNGKKLMVLKNPYGRIPFEILTMGDRYTDNNENYGSNLWELCRAQLECNKLDLLSNENVIYNGFAVWLLLNTNLESNKENTVKFGPRKMISINGLTDEDEIPSIQAISPTPQYQELEALKSEKIKKVLKNHGLPNSWLTDNPGIPPSGAAMKADRIELEEIRREDINILKPFEKKLIALIAQVLNTDQASDYKGKFSEEYEIQIDYAELSVVTEPKNELEYMNSLKSQGLITPLEYVKSLTGNENIKTDNDAITFINDNKELFAQTGGGDDGTESGPGTNGGVIEQNIPTGAGSQGAGETRGSNKNLNREAGQNGGQANKA